VPIWTLKCPHPARQRGPLRTLTKLRSRGLKKNATQLFAVCALACDDVHPFYWTEATGIQDLGTLPNGNTYAIATGLNLLDQAVGSSAFMQPFALTCPLLSFT
jgi:hypothetical protein